MASTQQINEVAIIPAELKPPTELLGMARAPELVLEEAARAAQALREVIERKPRKVVLNGKTFLQFEDWQTLGRFYGVTAVGRSTNPVNFGRVQGFESHAEALLVSSNQVISRAEAMCLDDEANWHGKPLYQLRSMAQTRACAKALRNVLAWVVVLAGYAPTPAEEMEQGQQVIIPVNDKRLPTLQVQALCAAIANAASIPELHGRYMEAGHTAQKANDRTALAEFIRAKDARKRELQ
jgi:hypothetical protein